MQLVRLCAQFSFKAQLAPIRDLKEKSQELSQLFFKKRKKSKSSIYTGNLEAFPQRRGPGKGVPSRL